MSIRVVPQGTTRIDLVALAGFWAAASIVGRVVCQAIFHATLGKALFGLCVISPECGGYPSFGHLLKMWFFHWCLSAVLLAWLLWPDPAGEGEDKSRDKNKLDAYRLPVVRRRDARREFAEI
ncbi:hypothetical protein ACL02S_09390 [Nocardia sp. 004]|uniref:hypothetical protein n=1 Tax=Nocardia sp. 004 TaxID=3385978 RepID=UPI0039A38745